MLRLRTHCSLQRSRTSFQISRQPANLKSRTLLHPQRLSLQKRFLLSRYAYNLPMELEGPVPPPSHSTFLRAAHYIKTRFFARRLTPTWGEWVAFNRLQKWGVNNNIRVVHLKKAIDIDVLNRALIEMRNKHPVTQYCHEDIRKQLAVPLLRYEHFKYVDVFVVEERYGEVTWQRVVREELNDPIESRRMLRITVVQKPKQEQGELVLCFNQMAADDKSIDAFIEDLLFTYIETQERIKIEEELKKQEEIRRKQREEEKRRMKIEKEIAQAAAAEAAEAMAAAHVGQAVPTTPSEQPTPEQPAPDGEENPEAVLSDSDWEEIIKEFRLRETLAKGGLSPTDIELYTRFPPFSPEQRKKIAEYWVEYRDLKAQANVDLSDPQLPLVQRAVATLAKKDLDDVTIKLKQAMFPFLKTFSSLPDMYEDVVQESLKTQRELFWASVENVYIRTTLALRVEQIKSRLVLDYLMGGSLRSLDYNALIKNPLPQELLRWIPPREHPSMEHIVTQGRGLLYLKSEYHNWNKEFEKQLLECVPSINYTMSPFRSWMKQLDTGAQAFIDSEVLFGSIDKEYIFGILRSVKASIKPEVLVATAFALAAKLAYDLPMTIELQHDYRDLFEPPVRATTLDCSSAPVLHPIDRDVLAIFSERKTIDVVSAAQVLQDQLDAYRKDNYLLDVMHTMFRHHCKIDVCDSPLMPSVSLRTSNVDLSTSVMRAFKVSRVTSAATNKHPWMSLSLSTSSTSTWDYSLTFPKVAPWTAERVQHIVKIAEALLEGADSSKIESLVAEASNELVEEEKETTTTTTAS